MGATMEACGTFKGTRLWRKPEQRHLDVLGNTEQEHARQEKGAISSTISVTCIAVILIPYAARHHRESEKHIRGEQIMGCFPSFPCQ